MSSLLLPSSPAALAPQRSAPLAAAASAADMAAARRIFDDYRERLADETQRRHSADLALFAKYLGEAGISVGDLEHDPLAWSGLSWGLVAGFAEWQRAAGYAIGSINVRLTTVKVYAKLAAKAGAISPEDHALIKLVVGYRHSEGKRIDRKREQTRQPGAKRATPASVTLAQARALKEQADPRDALLMALLIDHGLRVGEIGSLTRDSFDLETGQLVFYRSKVDKTQRHRLSAAALAAAKAYLATLDEDAPLFPGVRALRERVLKLGRRVGLDRLSPHDLRHYWATVATRSGTPLKALQDAGGWSSPAMPLRYAEAAAIANDDVIIPD